MRENLYKGVVPNSHSIDPSLSGTENMKEKKSMAYMKAMF